MAFRFDGLLYQRNVTPDRLMQELASHVVYVRLLFDKATTLGLAEFYEAITTPEHREIFKTLKASDLQNPALRVLGYGAKPERDPVYWLDKIPEGPLFRTGVYTFK